MATAAVALPRINGRRRSAATKKIEAAETGFRKSAWQELRIAMQRTKAHYTRKKRSQEQGDSCTNRDLDSSVHSYRSLVSETQQITGKSSWGRTFSSLHRNNRSPSPTERTKIPGSPSTSPRSVKSTNIDGIALCSMMARDKLRSPTPTSIRSNSEDDLASSFTVEELSAIALEGDNWQGTVTIGLGALQENVPPSPDQRSVRSLKLLNVPMTPPRLKKMSKKLVGSPKKTKQKRRKKSRGEKSKGSAAPVAWGDYAMAQNMTALHQREFSEKGRSGRTDGRRLKKKLLFDAFFEDNDHERGTTVAWGELLEICDPDEFRPTAVGNFDQSVLGRLSSLNLPDSPPSIMYDEDSFLGRFHAAHAQKRQEYCDESSQEDRLDDSMSTQCEETKTTKEDLEGNEDRRSSRLICFADEQGLPIERVRRVGDENDPWAMGRIIVLFLDPIARKFEFMQGEFSHRAGATVSDLLRQLPSFATEDRFATMEFSAMYSTSGPTRQFGLNEKLYELQLDRLEVTIAVMKGYSGENLLKEAAPVLKNKNIIRAVKKARRSGRGLKYIMSHRELLQDKANSQRRIGDNDRDDDVIPDMSYEYDTQPVLWHAGRQEGEDPHHMFKFLHASLWATIGMVYSANSA